VLTSVQVSLGTRVERLQALGPARLEVLVFVHLGRDVGMGVLSLSL
jgi:hypothetical protein